MSKKINLYVQVDVDLVDHYKLNRLVRKLSEDVHRTSTDIHRTSTDVQTPCPHLSGMSEMTLGMLFKLWSWALRFSPDEGRIDKLTDDEVAMEMGYLGDPGVLVKSLIETGFLSDDGTLSGWDEMYGALAARRASDAERKRNKRAEEKENVRRTSGGRPWMSGVEESRVEKSREADGSVNFEDGI